MRKLVWILPLALFLGFLPQINCIPDPTSVDSCAAVTPDGGTAAASTCAVAWSCNNDGTYHELDCDFVSGDFQCSCISDGAVTKQFTVNPFTCDNEGALPSAESACGWSISIAQ